MQISGLNSILFPPSPSPAGAEGLDSPDRAPFADAMASADGEALDPAPFPGPGFQPGGRSPAGLGPVDSGRGAALVAVPGTVPRTSPQGADLNVDALTRRAVWQEFLRKMKNELGVSAEDVLHAFASLPDEELARPPMETVDSVVAALGLAGQQAAQAKTYFQDLIQKTQARSLGDELRVSGRQIDLTLMSEREMQRRAMNQTVEQMNSAFFMTGGFARPAAPVSGVEETRNGTPINNSAPGRQVGEPSPIGTVPAEDPTRLSSVPVASEPLRAPVSSPEAPRSAPAFALPADGTEGVASLSVAPKIADASAAAGSSANSPRSVDEILRKFVASQTPAPSSPAPVWRGTGPAGSALTPAPGVPLMNPLATAIDGQPGTFDGGADDDGQDLFDASFLTAPGMATNSTFETAPASARDFQAQLSQANFDRPMTVPDLVQQARVMVREGGGEMKVTLHPDGLGEVAMNVSVDHGKVNVQMITESDEAKRLIERQLGDLKASLSHNHLQLADVKVETASGLSRQMEQQYQDAHRQTTQQAWEQFRQDNQGWRRSFFETPSARAYKGQSEAPRDVQAPTAGSGPRRAASRRLDLVA